MGFLEIVRGLKHQDFELLIKELQPLYLANIKCFPENMKADVMQEYQIITYELAKHISSTNISSPEKRNTSERND